MGGAKSFEIDVDSAKDDLLVYDHKKKGWSASNPKRLSFKPHKTKSANWEILPNSDSVPETVFGALDALSSSVSLMGLVEISSDYEALASDYLIITDSSSNTIDVTLPQISDIGDGKVYVIKDGSSSAGSNRVRVYRHSSANNVEGAVYKEISSNYGSLTLVGNGTRWLLI